MAKLSTTVAKWYFIYSVDSSDFSGEALDSFRGFTRGNQWPPEIPMAVEIFDREDWGWKSLPFEVWDWSLPIQLAKERLAGEKKNTHFYWCKYFNFFCEWELHREAANPKEVVRLVGLFTILIEGDVTRQRKGVLGFKSHKLWQGDEEIGGRN